MKQRIQTFRFFFCSWWCQQSNNGKSLIFFHWIWNFDFQIIDDLTESKNYERMKIWGWGWVCFEVQFLLFFFESSIDRQYFSSVSTTASFDFMSLITCWWDFPYFLNLATIQKAPYTNLLTHLSTKFYCKIMFIHFCYKIIFLNFFVVQWCFLKIMKNISSNL